MIRLVIRHTHIDKCCQYHLLVLFITKVVTLLSFFPSFSFFLLLSPSFPFFIYPFSSLKVTTLTMSASAIQLMQCHSLQDSDIATLEASIILFIPTFNNNLLLLIVSKRSLYLEAVCPFLYQAYTLQLRDQNQALLEFASFLLFRTTRHQDNSVRRYVDGICSKTTMFCQLRR
jgi:hypothetical protein